MSRAEHVRCPSCAGPVGITEIDRVITCAWCGARALVEGLPFVPEYRVAPRIDEAAARRKVQRLLGGPPMPRGLLGASRLRSARLYHVPYNEICARRMGLLVVGRPGPSAARAGSSTPGGARNTADTRVVTGEIHRVEPAVRMPEWALEESALVRGTAEDLALEPCDRARLAREGRILHPTVDAEDILGGFGDTRYAATIEDGTEVAELRVRRVFYPVFHVTYEHHGRLYGASVDGVTGAIMGARGPQGDRQRAAWMVGAALLVAILAGGFARAAFELFVRRGDPLDMWRTFFDSPYVFSILLASFFLILLTVLAVAWDQYRYPGEIAIRGDRVDLEKIGAPADNALMRFVSRMSDLIGRLIEAR